MPTIRIFSIIKPAGAVTTADNYRYLANHLNEDLPLMSVAWDRYGQVSNCAIRNGDHSVITIFMQDAHCNDTVTYKINYGG